MKRLSSECIDLRLFLSFLTCCLSLIFLAHLLIAFASFFYVVCLVHLVSHQYWRLIVAVTCLFCLSLVCRAFLCVSFGHFSHSTLLPSLCH